MANIVRFDPFEDMARLQREVSRLFEDGSHSASALTTARTWAPAVDIFEDRQEIILRAELPGMNQADIDIELTGDTLTLTGERRFDETHRKDNYVRVERAYGHFHRSFTISVPVQADAVRATYKDGLLEVHLPKTEETRSKKVIVTAG